MLDIAGKVTFKHCVFADNAHRDDTDEHPGNVSCLQVGGGVLLKLTTKGDIHQNISHRIKFYIATTIITFSSTVLSEITE